jgi:DNA-binding transcriptional MerR regulator
MTEAENAGNEVTIGEFARLSRLAPKALRLYDQAGILEPARIDPTSGARRYRRDQLGRARLVAALRQVGIPLAEIGSALSEEGSLGAERIAAYWAEAEAEHAARRRLVSSLIDRLRGNADSTSMAYAVGLRALPDRSVLTQTRHVHVDGLTAAREEFVGTFLQAGVPQLGGARGAPFTVYYGEVSFDSDGPIEWCWPVAEQEAERLSARFPDLTLRTDPAHQEAYVHYGATTQLHAARISLAAQSLLAWAQDQDRRGSGGMRLVYLSPGDGAEVDCDVVLPLLHKG